MLPLSEKVKLLDLIRHCIISHHHRKRQYSTKHIYIYTHIYMCVCVYIGSGTICNFRHPVGVLEHVPCG